MKNINSKKKKQQQIPNSSYEAPTESHCSQTSPLLPKSSIVAVVVGLSAGEQQLLLVSSPFRQSLYQFHLYFLRLGFASDSHGFYFGDNNDADDVNDDNLLLQVLLLMMILILIFILLMMNDSSPFQFQSFPIPFSKRYNRFFVI